MIGYVRGYVDTVFEDKVLIDNNGIGYEIFVPGSVIERMPGAGEEVKLYTYLYVREDQMSLYGFLTSDELTFFKMLITVSGIGPKGALGILSVMDVDSLRFAILAQDSKSIAKAPGIGKKTAEKVILELRDKCDADDFLDTSQDITGTVGTADTSSDDAKDAISALVALGYSSTDAMRAVRALGSLDGLSVNDILKLALKQL